MASAGCSINRDYRVNEQILRGPREQRVRDVRVIDEVGEVVGIIPVRDALALAQQKGLDLIEIAPHAQPPVCRIMDYGKYKFDQGKRDREQHKKQRHQDVKGVSMGPATAEHDFQVRVRAIQRFLGEGDKVRIVVKFRGRAITHPELGRRLLDRIVEACADHAIVEKPPGIEGRDMTIVLSPKS